MFSARSFGLTWSASPSAVLDLAGVLDVTVQSAQPGTVLKLSQPAGDVAAIEALRQRNECLIAIARHIGEDPAHLIVDVFGNLALLPEQLRKGCGEVRSVRR